MTAEEKELVARGADCVLGDLILNRVTVGRYRNGQFLLTPEGRNELDTVVQARPTAAPKAAKAAKATKAAEAAVHDPAGLLRQDDLDLLSGLGD